MDVYQRSGITTVEPPYRAGVEGVGVIVEVGSSVTDVLVGQRVGWLSGGQGSFADYAVVEAARPSRYQTRSMPSRLLRCSCRGVTAHSLAMDI
jgi:NADPH2:quinone reductase